MFPGFEHARSSFQSPRDFLRYFRPPGPPDKAVGTILIHFWSQDKPCFRISMLALIWLEISLKYVPSFRIPRDFLHWFDPCSPQKMCWCKKQALFNFLLLKRKVSTLTGLRSRFWTLVFSLPSLCRLRSCFFILSPSTWTIRFLDLSFFFFLV